ncbi:MAG TPA: hypothetical protein VF950_09780, partial [Planctomycetota bacterium]
MDGRFVGALESRLAEIAAAMDAVRLNPDDPSRVADAVRRLEELFGLEGTLSLSRISGSPDDLL